MANLIINLSTITKTSEGHVYKDIAFPVTPDFDVNYDVNAVKQSINNIFSWRRGQRILDPLFGNIIYDYVYEPINNVTIKNLKNGIVSMLAYEPRISIVSLDVKTKEDDNTIYVALKYLIPKLDVIESYSTDIVATAL